MKVNKKRFVINPGEILKISSFGERLLNHGRMNLITRRATIVAAKV